MNHRITFNTQDKDVKLNVYFKGSLYPQCYQIIDNELRYNKELEVKQITSSNWELN